MGQMCSTEVNFFPKYSVIHRKKKIEGKNIDTNEESFGGKSIFDGENKRKIKHEISSSCKTQNDDEIKKANGCKKHGKKEAVQSKLSLLSAVSSNLELHPEKNKNSVEEYADEKKKGEETK